MCRSAVYELLWEMSVGADPDENTNLVKRPEYAELVGKLTHRLLERVAKGTNE